MGVVVIACRWSAQHLHTLAKETPQHRRPGRVAFFAEFGAGPDVTAVAERAHAILFNNAHASVPAVMAEFGAVAALVDGAEAVLPVPLIGGGVGQREAAGGKLVEHIVRERPREGVDLLTRAVVGSIVIVNEVAHRRSTPGDVTLGQPLERIVNERVQISRGGACLLDPVGDLPDGVVRIGLHRNRGGPQSMSNLLEAAILVVAEVSKG